MFKVICTKDDIQCDNYGVDHKMLRFGEIYTVIRVLTLPDRKGVVCKWYCLSEFPGYDFVERFFSPLSNVDETEMTRKANRPQTNLHPVFEQILKPFMPVLFILLTLASCTKEKSFERTIKMDSCCHQNDSVPSNFVRH